MPSLYLFPVTFDLIILFLLSASFIWISVALTNKVVHDWWKSEHSQYPSLNDFLCLPKFIKESIATTRKCFKILLGNKHDYRKKKS